MKAGLSTSLYLACQPFMAAAKAVQPEPPIPVWKFEYTGWPWSASWRTFPASQLGVLEVFLREAPNCYLQMGPSDVLEWASSKDWERPYSETFQLPPGVHGAQLTEKVLYLGGYHLYCATAPVEPSRLSFNPWRSAPARLLESLGGSGITGSIFAHHDNDEWLLCFPGVQPQ